MAVPSEVISANTPFAFRSEANITMINTTFSAPASKPATRRTVDAPTRVMHWLMALSFLGAYVTADGERWRLLHVTLGYTLAGLLAFRVVWGLIGPRHARLSALWRKLQGLPLWLKGLKAGAPNGRLAQNLLLTLSVVALLALIAPLTLSGYGTYHEWAGEWLEEVHEFFGNALLAVVLAHIALIAGLSLLRRKNQVTPMLTGRVDGAGPDLLKSNYTTVAALLLAAVLGFGAWQWQQAPTVGPGGSGGGADLTEGGRDAPARQGAYDGRRAREHRERHHD
jgi:cytochrome b